jgi:hypothetical protein
MKVSAEEKKRINSGDVTTLRGVLSRELEDIKNQLLSFRATNPEYDIVLKGRGAMVKDLLDLLA